MDSYLIVEDCSMLHNVTDTHIVTILPVLLLKLLLKMLQYHYHWSEDDSAFSVCLREGEGKKTYHSMIVF